jgi:hypothetical protein
LIRAARAPNQPVEGSRMCPTLLVCPDKRPFAAGQSVRGSCTSLSTWGV